MILASAPLLFFGSKIRTLGLSKYAKRTRSFLRSATSNAPEEASQIS